MQEACEHTHVDIYTAGYDMPLVTERATYAALELFSHGVVKVHTPSAGAYASSEYACTHMFPRLQVWSAYVLKLLRTVLFKSISIAHVCEIFKNLSV